MSEEKSTSEPATSEPDFEQRFKLATQRHNEGRHEQAEAIFRWLAAQRPDMAEAFYNLGVVLQAQGKLREAHQAYHQALKLKPDLAEGWVNLGNVYHAIKQPTQAIAAYRRAMALQPADPMIYNNLGSSLRDLDKLTEAIAAFRHGLSLNPKLPLLWNNLAVVVRSVGKIDEAAKCFNRGLALKPDDAEAASGRLYTLSFHPGCDESALGREARLWNERYARPFRNSFPNYSNDPSPQRRLRVGYVAPDFRAHCQSLFTVPLFANHDHTRFEIFCYSSTGAKDETTAVLRSHVDVWRDILPVPDQAAAEMIHQDRIDILVDLTLHMGGNRLLIFARKPAPIQVTWLGYPGTTGLEAIDYRLTDPWLDPPYSNESEIRSPKSEIRINDPNPNDPISLGGQSSQQSLPHSVIGKLTSASSVEPGFDSDFGFRISDFSTKESYYCERSVRLPDTFWCYDPLTLYGATKTDSPEPGPLPALEAGHITFGCLNNFCKVSDGALALWVRVMAAVPDSHLILLAPPGPQREEILRKMGLTSARVHFVPFLPRRLYLEIYRRVDMCLDTIPYNGHTTSLDSLWMGVPVVTRVGRTVVGRAGWSQLHNLGLDELVAWNDEQFVTVASTLAGDLPRLGELRATLRKRMEQSPLMDGARFARGVESAYRRMWQAWCKTRERPS